MKFLLEFVTSCASCTSEIPRDEAGLLVIQEPRRRVVRKRARVRGGGTEWRPSLSSISEDVLTAEKINKVKRPAAGWRRSLEKKVDSSSPRDRRHSLDHEDCRGAPGSAIMPTFSPTPFMF